MAAFRAEAARVLTKRELAEQLRRELDSFIREELAEVRHEVTRTMREANLALAQMNQALQTLEALRMDVAQAEREAAAERENAQ
jgi:hypothetical protein